MTTVLDRINALLDAPATGEEAPPLDRMEHTLTEGYAYALELEAERWRLERQISAVAAALHTGESTAELSSLASRFTVADTELSRLRSLLNRLRDRVRSLRSAVPS
jgi:hypothetical protein